MLTAGAELTCEHSPNVVGRWSVWRSPFSRVPFGVHGVCWGVVRLSSSGQIVASRMQTEEQKGRGLRKKRQCCQIRKQNISTLAQKHAAENMHFGSESRVEFPFIQIRQQRIVHLLMYSMTLLNGSYEPQKYNSPYFMYTICFNQESTWSV